MTRRENIVLEVDSEITVGDRKLPCTLRLLLGKSGNLFATICFPDCADEPIYACHLVNALEQYGIEIGEIDPPRGD